MERTIWMRVGVTLKGTEEEIEALFGTNGNQNLKKLLSESKFEFDGDSFIPEICVEDYNNEYGTTHVGDYDFYI